MTRLPLPGWSFGMPSGSARNCLQRNRPFRLSAAGAGVLSLPGRTAAVQALEGYKVRILNGKFFVLEASSVCSNVVPRLSVSLLTRRYTCRDLDDKKEGTLRG